jgi:hypothetical protein
MLLVMALVTTLMAGPMLSYFTGSAPAPDPPAGKVA